MCALQNPCSVTKQWSYIIIVVAVLFSSCHTHTHGRTITESQSGLSAFSIQYRKVSSVTRQQTAQWFHVLTSWQYTGPWFDTTPGQMVLHPTPSEGKTFTYVNWLLLLLYRTFFPHINQPQLLRDKEFLYQPFICQCLYYHLFGIMCAIHYA